jgi:hypothetical protein
VASTLTTRPPRATEEYGGGRGKEMENKSIKQRRTGIDHKGSQGQTQRAAVLQEEEEEETILVKRPNIKFHEDLFNLSRTIPYVRTEEVILTGAPHGYERPYNTAHVAN